MTMQIGMVGSDGILIASDTRWTAIPNLRLNERWVGGRYGHNATKIRVNRRKGIAIGCARNMETANQVATAIFERLGDADLNNPAYAIQEIGERIRRSLTTDRDDAQCIIALIHPSPQLLLFQYGTVDGYWHSICEEMERFAVAGDTVNAAIFWAERFYEKRPIRELAPLAAHLVKNAAHLNSAMISGLEVILCDHSGLQRLSKESIQALEVQSAAVDKMLVDSFFRSNQQFT